MPLTAVLVLGASPAAMGLLSATGGLSFLFFSLAAGVVVDRFRRRPLMIASDVGRALLLLSIPACAVLHILSLAQLILVNGCAAALTVLFDVAYRSFLPSLVLESELLDGNRMLSLSSATAEILGPSLTGVLVQLISAPRAIFFDALSFLFSAFSLSAIKCSEEREFPTARRIAPQRCSLVREASDGFRAILAHPVLRVLFFRALTSFLAMGPLSAFYVLFAIRDLHLTPALLGFTISFGGAGSIVGGLFAGSISRRFSMQFVFFSNALVIALMQFLFPLASIHPRFAVPLVCTQQFFGDCAWTIYIVNEVSLRQRVIGPELLGRVNAAMELASRGMLPLGALVGGYLGNRFGMQNVLWLGAAGSLASTLWLLPLLTLEPRSESDEAAG